MLYKDIEDMRKKADEGELDAIVQLGISYLYGYGVEKDYVEAFIYLQEAVTKNDSEAMLHLGKMYENGWGIKPDLWIAYSMYRRSYKLHCDGSRKALSGCVDKIADSIPITGRLTISNDYRITACCERFREHFRMGRIIPFDDDEGSDLYMSNMNRNVKMRECPYCGCPVQKV